MSCYAHGNTNGTRLGSGSSYPLPHWRICREKHKWRRHVQPEDLDTSDICLNCVIGAMQVDASSNSWLIVLGISPARSKALTSWTTRTLGPRIRIPLCSRTLGHASLSPTAWLNKDTETAALKSDRISIGYRQRKRGGCRPDCVRIASPVTNLHKMSHFPSHLNCETMHAALCWSIRSLESDTGFDPQNIFLYRGSS
jgi:hypothetical protein